MKILILLLTLFTDDLTDARRRYEDALARQASERAIEEQIEQPVPVIEINTPKPEPVQPDPKETQSRVDARWVFSQPTESYSASVLLVGESWCVPCNNREKELIRQGISYKKLTVNEAAAAGLPLRRNADNKVPIPQEFPGTSMKSTQAPAATIVEVSDSIDLSIVNLLSQHLDAQHTGERPVSGILDIDVDAPAYIPDLLNGLLIGQQWESPANGLTLNWEGSRTIRVDSGKLAFTPAVKVTKKVGPLSVKATLDAVTISQNGRQIDLSLGGAPDLTIVLKGVQYQHVQSVASAMPAVVRNVSDQPQNYTESQRQSDIDHLLTGPAHAGKFTRAYLETLSGYQLIDLHNSEHGVFTLKGVKIR